MQRLKKVMEYATSVCKHCNSNKADSLDTEEGGAESVLRRAACQNADLEDSTQAVGEIAQGTINACQTKHLNPAFLRQCEGTAARLQPTAPGQRTMNRMPQVPQSACTILYMLRQSSLGQKWILRDAEIGIFTTRPSQPLFQYYGSNVSVN